MANQSERVAFTRQAAARISDAVRKIEAGDRASQGLRFGSVSGPAAASVFRVCTFTGSWAINSAKTVTFKYQSVTPNTVVATNILANISTSASSQRNCAVARDGTAWFLIAAEC